MKQYPLLFTFEDKVFGKGFLASVSMHGSLLAEREDEGWWMYGVQPGDLAAGGVSFAEAHCEFRKTFSSILYDIAEDVQDFKTFKAEVSQFFGGVNHPTEKEWSEAVIQVRAGKIAAQDISKGLREQPAESPRYVEVKSLLECDFKPEDNVVDPQMAMAA